MNLSLGGAFDPASFGCGDSPLCASLLRLVRQGVLVVLAAGNEGSGDIVVDGFNSTRSFDLSIGDPANLEEAIAVGSAHPTLPHRYGTSYFSSWGPTAHGRLKPDRGGSGGTDPLLPQQQRSPAAAPDGTGRTASMSSTSPSRARAWRRPHLRAAGRLPVGAPEFIGYPERVKKILLEHCTDLRRDRYHQGTHGPAQPLQDATGNIRSRYSLIDF